jgi:hypothetical protein
MRRVTESLLRDAQPHPTIFEDKEGKEGGEAEEAREGETDEEGKAAGVEGKGAALVAALLASTDRRPDDAGATDTLPARRMMMTGSGFAERSIKLTRRC